MQKSHCGIFYRKSKLVLQRGEKCTICNRVGVDLLGSETLYQSNATDGRASIGLSTAVAECTKRGLRCFSSYHNSTTTYLGFPFLCCCLLPQILRYPLHVMPQIIFCFSRLHGNHAFLGFHIEPHPLADSPKYEMGGCPYFLPF